MYLHMRNAAKRSYKQSSVESPSSPDPPAQETQENDLSPLDENNEVVMDSEPSNLPPCEVFGKLNKGLDASHASSLSPPTTELSHFSQALGPQNLRKRSFPMLEEENNRPLYTLLDPKTKFDRGECKITSICFTGNGELVVADAGNSKVKVFDIGGQLKVECIIPVNYGSLIEPVSVSCSPKDQIVVADKSGGDLKVFTKDGHFLTSFGEELKKPCGVVVNNQGNVIAVVEGSRKIYIFKKIGSNEYTTFSVDLKDHSTGSGLKSVGVSKSGNIVVADEISGTILVYDCFGKFLRKHINEQPSEAIGVRRPNSLVSHYGLGQLKRPTGITDDHLGNVFIVDEENCRVVHFDLTNNVFLRPIISRSDGLDKPWGIASNSKGQLAVIERSNKVIKIYDISSRLNQ